MFEILSTIEEEPLVGHRRFESIDDINAGLRKCFLYYRNKPVYIREVLSPELVEAIDEEQNIFSINVNSRYLSMRTPFVGYIQDYQNQAFYYNQKAERQWKRGVTDRGGDLPKENIFRALSNKYYSIGECTNSNSVMSRNKTAFHKFFAVEPYNSKFRVLFKDKLFGFYDAKEKSLNILPEYDNITYRKLINDIIR